METLPTPQNTGASTKKENGLQGGYFCKPQEKPLQMLYKYGSTETGKVAGEAAADPTEVTASEAADTKKSSSEVEGSLTAAAWKEKGNALFKAGKPEAAIEAYFRNPHSGRSGVPGRSP